MVNKIKDVKGRFVRTFNPMTIIGQTYGRLTAISVIGSNGLKNLKCVCSCGGETLINSHSFGRTKSCGCLKAESSARTAIFTNYRHGMSRSKVFAVWASMLQRCRDSKCKAFKNYGGRGIMVCEKWQTFEGFFEEMGEPGKNQSIDRIDVNGNYSKENCRWTDRKTQSRNRRSNRTITFNGKTACISEWSENLGLSKTLIRTRLNLGWPVEDVLSLKKYHRWNPRPLKD